MAREHENRFGKSGRSENTDKASAGSSPSESASPTEGSEDPPPPPPRPVPGEGETFGRLSISMGGFAGSGKGQKVSQSDIPAPGSRKKE